MPRAGGGRRETKGNDEKETKNREKEKAHKEETERGEGAKNSKDVSVRNDALPVTVLYLIRPWEGRWGYV